MSKRDNLLQQLSRLRFAEEEIKRRISQSMQKTSAFMRTENCKNLQRKLANIQQQIATVRDKLAQCSTRPSRPSRVSMAKPSSIGAGWVIAGALVALVALAASEKK